MKAKQLKKDLLPVDACVPSAVRDYWLRSASVVSVSEQTFSVWSSMPREDHSPLRNSSVDFPEFLIDGAALHQINGRRSNTSLSGQSVMTSRAPKNCCDSAAILTAAVNECTPAIPENTLFRPSGLKTSRLRAASARRTLDLTSSRRCGLYRSVRVIR